MITAADVQGKLKRVPFVPFRIVTSSGEHYEVPHPEWALVTRRFVEIGLLNPDFPEFPDLVKAVSMLHITALEDIAPSAASKHKSNGKKK
jgi:hypothetical protein